MITSIGNAAVWVTDLGRSERFYCEGLGLEVIARIETPQVRELIVGRSGEGSQLMLAELVGAGSRDDGETTIPTDVVPAEGTRPTGLWKSFLWSDDVAADVKSACAAGGTLVDAPHQLPEFALTIAVVADPDGHFVELGCLG